jgi:hypothetical protein
MIPTPYIPKDNPIVEVVNDDVLAKRFSGYVGLMSAAFIVGPFNQIATRLSCGDAVRDVFNEWKTNPRKIFAGTALMSMRYGGAVLSRLIAEEVFAALESNTEFKLQGKQRKFSMAALAATFETVLTFKVDHNETLKTLPNNLKNKSVNRTPTYSLQAQRFGLVAGRNFFPSAAFIFMMGNVGQSADVSMSYKVASAFALGAFGAALSSGPNAWFKGSYKNGVVQSVSFETIGKQLPYRFLYGGGTKVTAFLVAEALLSARNAYLKDRDDGGDGPDAGAVAKESGSDVSVSSGSDGTKGFSFVGLARSGGLRSPELSGADVALKKALNPQDDLSPLERLQARVREGFAVGV